MPWADVKHILLNEVVTLMADQDKGREWVKILEFSPDGPRLGACIAIDVVSGALSATVFASILDIIRTPYTDARWAFAKAVERHPHSFVCSSVFSPRPLDNDDTYVRVQELGDFITHYAGPAHGYSSLDPDDIREVERIFFNEEEEEPWPDIDVEWSGSMGRVFVLSNKELIELLKGQVDKGAVVNDSLGLAKLSGLGPGNKPYFIKVLYPKDLTHKCAQPTTLDVPWTNPNWFYVSYGNVDTWGRTQSCSGIGPIVRERVHVKLASLTTSFSGGHIGIAASPLTTNRDNLLEEAYNRLATFLPSVT